MELTTNSRDYLNKPAVGYMVNTLLSESSHKRVKVLQDTFASNFHEAVWTTPANALHITLLDWLAPLVDYDGEKDKIFEKIYPEYNSALNDILKTVNAINITFDRLTISSSAVAIVADEKSTQIFNDIRQRFLDKVDLLPNTKQPPNIVHSTIVRFVGEVALDSVKNVANSSEFSFTETVPDFQLVRETAIPMLGYSVVKKYPLQE